MTIPSSNISNPVVPVYLSTCEITSESFLSDCTNITTQESSRDSEKEENAEVKEKVENVLTLLSVKKKYKPVAQKTKSVLAELPQKFRVVRKIEGNPLKDMPVLDPNPPPFQPCGRYTQEISSYRTNAHYYMISYASKMKVLLGTIRNAEVLEPISSHRLIFQSFRTLLGSRRIFRYLQAYTKKFAKSYAKRLRLAFTNPQIRPIVRNGLWFLRKTEQAYSPFIVSNL